MTIFRIIHHLQHIMLVNIVSEEIPTHKGQHWKTKLTGKEKNMLQKCCLLCSCKMDWGEVESCLCSYVSNFKFMLEFMRAALTRLKRRGTVRLVVFAVRKGLIYLCKTMPDPILRRVHSTALLQESQGEKLACLQFRPVAYWKHWINRKKKKTTRSSKKHLIYKTAAAGLLDPQTFKECVVRNREKPDPNLFKMCS